jgi:hypothetical protein
VQGLAGLEQISTVRDALSWSAGVEGTEFRAGSGGEPGLYDCAVL